MTRLRKSLDIFADNLVQMPLEKWNRRRLVQLAAKTDPGFLTKTTGKHLVPGGFFGACMVFSEYGPKSRYALERRMAYHGYQPMGRRTLPGRARAVRRVPRADLDARICEDLPAWLLRHLFAKGGIKSGIFQDLFLKAMEYNGLSNRGTWILRGLLSSTAGMSLRVFTNLTNSDMFQAIYFADGCAVSEISGQFHDASADQSDIMCGHAHPDQPGDVCFECMIKYNLYKSTQLLMVYIRHGQLAASCVQICYVIIVRDSRNIYLHVHLSLYCHYFTPQNAPGLRTHTIPPTVRGKRKKGAAPAVGVLDGHLEQRDQGMMRFETFDNFERNYRPKSISAEAARQGHDWKEANWTAVGYVISSTPASEMQVRPSHKPIWPLVTFCSEEAAWKLRWATVCHD